MSQITAFVARIDHTAEPAFMRMAPGGEIEWVVDPSIATAFESVREATRWASRLPSKLRAFGILRRCEQSAR